MANRKCRSTCYISQSQTEPFCSTGTITVIHQQAEAAVQTAISLIEPSLSLFIACAEHIMIAFILADLRLNHWYFLMYGVWSKIIFIELIPYISILICNAFIITKITKERQKLLHRKMTLRYLLQFIQNVSDSKIACRFHSRPGSDENPPPRNRRGRGRCRNNCSLNC